MKKRKRKPGGGRKKKHPTKVVRIPVSIEDMVNKAKREFQIHQAKVIIGRMESKIGTDEKQG